LKKLLFLFLTVCFTAINSAQAEQWIYIKERPNISDSAAILFDLDSIEFNDSDNSITFNIKKDDATTAYIHKIKYSYKSKQFAVLESTKYLSWVSPENKVHTEVFKNPEYKSSQENSLSEQIEMFISDKKNLINMKDYISVNQKELSKKLSSSLKEIDEANILFWIDGEGNIYSYEYLFGNVNYFPTSNTIKYGDNLLNYSIVIQCYPNAKKTTDKKMPSIDVYKKGLNPTTKKASYSSNGQIISSVFIQDAMTPNMPAMARMVYQAQMPNRPDSSYGKLSNKDFYDKFMATMISDQYTDKQKKMAVQLFAIQSLNYNEKLNTQLKEVKELKTYSKSYKKGVIGIVMNLK